MNFASTPTVDEVDAIPLMPNWVTPAKAQTCEELAFMSGAALAHLHLVLMRDEVPQALLRDRLALRAAEACMKIAGRSERAGDLRDAVHLMRPGDLPGPAGEIYLNWRRAGERPISVKSLHRAMPECGAEGIARWMDAGTGAPVARAATVLETVLSETRHQDVIALILADAVLARSLGWTHVMPLLAVGLKRADLTKRGEELRMACHRAITMAAVDAVRLAADLARREARLNAVAPKLRAKGAAEAVKLFLSCDAVAPSALTSLNSARAARRLCDRLVELGAVHELTGRDTFRLYGV